MKLEIVMMNGNVHVSRSYSDIHREMWEDKVVSRIGTAQSLAVDLVENGQLITRTFNPRNIESLRILED